MNDTDALIEAKAFYVDRIKGWMINDLKRSIEANTNFLTTLGCFTYTEVVGHFLPPLTKERGKNESRRFYRCLFAFKSHTYLQQLNIHLTRQTGRGIYEHLRHSMMHKYSPRVSKTTHGIIYTIPSIIAKEGIIIDQVTGVKSKSPPIFLSDNGHIAIANTNFVEELEIAVDEAYNRTFIQNDDNYIRASISGIKQLYI